MVLVDSIRGKENSVCEGFGEGAHLRVHYYDVLVGPLAVARQNLKVLDEELLL